MNEMVTAKVLAKVAILAFFYFFKVQLPSNQKSVLTRRILVISFSCITLFFVLMFLPRVFRLQKELQL